VFEFLVPAFVPVFAHTMGGSASAPQQLVACRGGSRPSFSNREFKILLVGETGSGKTSFLNFLCNIPDIMKEQNKHEMGDPSAWLGFTPKKYHREENENQQEKDSNMHSKTENPLSYSIPIPGFNFTVLDTPGLGDTRGMEFDKRHIERISQALISDSLGFLNAIVLVINGQVPRANILIRTVLATICSMFPKSITDQIVIVYTRTKEWHNLAFSVDSLTEVLSRTVVDEDQFCFDNPIAELEQLQQYAQKAATKGKGKAKGVVSGKDAVAHGFEKALTDLGYFFDRLKTFRNVHSNQFEELYKARATVEEQALGIRGKLDMIPKKRAEIANLMSQIQSATDQAKLSSSFETMRVKQVKSQRKTPNNHNMICGGCKNTCHASCEVERTLTADLSKYRRCKCFARTTRRTVEMDRSDIQRLKSASFEDTCTMYDTHEGRSASTKTSRTSNRIILTQDLNFKNSNGLVETFISRAKEHSNAAFLPEWSDTIEMRASIYCHYCDITPGTKVTINDMSDCLKGRGNPCSECGCNLDVHYHAEWVYEDVDDSESLAKKQEMQQQFNNAKSLEESKTRAMKKCQEDLAALERDEKAMEAKLAQCLETFRQKSTVSDYTLVLSQQRELLKYQLEQVRQDPSLMTSARDACVKKYQDQMKELEVKLDAMTRAKRQ